MDGWLGFLCVIAVCIGGIILISFIVAMIIYYFVNRQYTKGEKRVEAIVLPSVANKESTIVIDVDRDCCGFNSIAVSYISILNNEGYVLQSQSDGVYTFYKKFNT